MNADLIRFIDSISREKSIEKESVFLDLEAAIASAIRKATDETAEILVEIDRIGGEIRATANGSPVDMKLLGRIPAQTAKQVLIQKVREDERNSIFEEYSGRVGQVVTGTVSRYEGGALIVSLGRAEGILPRGEQIPGETHHAAERLRAMILDVREERNQVRIVLTQTHPDYIRRLFELEVPEVGERIIEIRALAREAGYRTKVAVTSIDMKVDAVGACVGVRGSRIRNIVDELGGEKIDIVRWNESSQILIANALKPAVVQETFLCFELGRATVVVAEDQLSLAIGKRGQNVRLAARLTGWDIDIMTPAEYNRNLDAMEQALKKIEGVEDVLLDKLLAIGLISVHLLAETGVEPLTETLDLEEALATRIVEMAAETARRLDEEAAAAKALAVKEAAARAALEAQSAASSETEPGEPAEDPTDGKLLQDATLTGGDTDSAEHDGHAGLVEGEADPMRADEGDSPVGTAAHTFSSPTSDAGDSVEDEAGEVPAELDAGKTVPSAVRLAEDGSGMPEPSSVPGVEEEE
jgi:N utilization substance protein A